ncbi:hypothetical protein ADUPG1_001826, partial [Aduncisulcus paluster]
FSELSLSDGTSKTTSSCPTYWGIPGKKGNFPKCPYCEMTNHPVTHCQKAYGGEKKPFGEGEKVPLTKPEVAEYYNEAREKWGKKAPEEMKQKFLDWRRSAMSVAIEPWQKKAKLLNSGVKVFVKRGRNYALSAEQRRKAHKNGEHYLEDTPGRTGKRRRSMYGGMPMGGMTPWPQMPGMMYPMMPQY